MIRIPSAPNFKSSRSALLAVVASVAFAATSAQAATLVDEVRGRDAAKAEQLLAGSQVTLTQEVSGSVWPRTMVCQLFNGSPDEFAAVFADYNSHKNFFKDMTRSEVVNQVSPTIADVGYTLEIPVIPGVPFTLPAENYTVRDTLSTYSSDQGPAFRIDWVRVTATEADEINGNLRAETYNGRTVMCYTNFIKPKRSIARLVRSQSITRVQETATAIAQEVAQRRSSGALPALVRSLRTALGL